MRADGAWLDIGIGLLAGLVATRVTEYGQQALWALTPKCIQDQESRVRPRPPYRLAAQKTAATLRLKVEPKRLEQMGMAFHYGSGTTWGTIYCLMRRAAGMESLGAGIAAGTSMSVLLDELVTPGLGFSAPDRDYPAATHMRGLLGHLLYGTALAGAAEALYWTAKRAREASHRAANAENPA